MSVEDFDRRGVPTDPAKIGRRKSDFVTRNMFITGGIIIGLGLALALGGVLLMALKVNSIQQDAIKKNSEINAAQNRVLRKLRQLTQPTPAEYREQLKEGIKRCLSEPSCKDLFPTLKDTASSRTGEGARSRASSSPGGSPATPESTAEEPADEGEPRASVPRFPRGFPKDDPPPSSGGSQPVPSSPPPAEKPRPAVDVKDVPLLPGICVGEVLGINCD